MRAASNNVVIILLSDTPASRRHSPSRLEHRCPTSRSPWNRQPGRPLPGGSPSPRSPARHRVRRRAPGPRPRRRGTAVDHIVERRPTSTQRPVNAARGPRHRQIGEFHDRPRRCLQWRATQRRRTAGCVFGQHGGQPVHRHGVGSDPPGRQVFNVAGVRRRPAPGCTRHDRAAGPRGPGHPTAPPGTVQPARSGL